MTSSPPLEIVVLAAGKGTRMRSALPKVLHQVAGRPLLAHVLATARALAPRCIHVVYGHGGAQVPGAFADAGVVWVEQREQKGTGHALQQAAPGIGPDAQVLVLYGDVPLTRLETLRAVTALAKRDALALLTVTLDDATGYGRIVRDARAAVRRIVEHKDANADERRLNEVNTGILAAPASRLNAWLAKLRNDNAQGEYYLTDVIALAVADGVEINTAQPRDRWEVLGVNSKIELAALERAAQQERARTLMEQGVTLRDPARLDVRGTLECGQDVVIDVNCVFEGAVRLGNRVHVGANAVIRDARLGDDVVVKPHCLIEGADIGDACEVGPFARIRPGTRLAARARIGNFVEIKQSEVGEGSKINHLSYVGDTEVGCHVNVGAGVITCNYDGANKHRTVIGDNAFIGSDCQLVAPVAIGEGATIGAGSTITRDAPPNELTLSRVKQTSVPHWKRPAKKTTNGKP